MGTVISFHTKEIISTWALVGSKRQRDKIEAAKLLPLRVFHFDSLLLLDSMPNEYIWFLNSQEGELRI